VLGYVVGVAAKSITSGALEGEVRAKKVDEKGSAFGVPSAKPVTPPMQAV
jgi:hypothetical protein